MRQVLRTALIAWALTTPLIDGRVDARESHCVFRADCNADADGDGVANGFAGVAGKFRLVQRDGDLCQEAGVPTGKPRFAEVLRSSAFSVEPRTLYAVCFRCKGRALSIFHVKLRWLDEKSRTVKTVQGKNYEQMFSPARRVPHQSWWDAAKAAHWLPSRESSGDWDWETWQGFYVAPQGASAARIEFWAEREGGEFWVDGLSVLETPGLRQPTRSFCPGRFGSS